MRFLHTFSVTGGQRDTFCARILSDGRVEVEQKRIHTLIFGQPLLKDRDEEEVRGYRDALNFIHGQGANIPISEETILKFHQVIRGEIWDAGKYKEKNRDIIEKYVDGRERVRFKTVEASRTPET